jgi:hypothetical protein
MEYHAPQDDETVFLHDVGKSVKRDYSYTFTSWGAYFLIIVVLAGIKGSFGLLYFLGGAAVSATLAALLSFAGMYSAISEIRFTSTNMEFSSTMFRAIRRGKYFTIPYDQCYVRETNYWHFRKIHVLLFKSEKRSKCLVTDASFGASYQRIKSELARRLPKEHLDLKNTP